MADPSKTENPFLITEQSKPVVVDIFAEPSRPVFSDSVVKGESSSGSLSGQFDQPKSESESRTLFGAASSSSKNIFGGKISSPKQPEASWRLSGVADVSKSSPQLEGTASTTSSDSRSSFQQKFQAMVPDPVFGSYSKMVKDQKTSLFGGIQDVSSLPSGCSLAPATSAVSKVDEDNGKVAINPQKPALVFGARLSGRDSSKSVDSGQFTSFRMDNPKSSLASSSDSSQSLKRSRSSEKKGSDDEDSELVGSAAKRPVVFPCESTTLVAVEVPEKYLEKTILYNHFAKFGTVKKVFINKKSNQASICFNDHESATLAKAKGKLLHPLIPEMKLFFGAATQPPKKKVVLQKTPLAQIKKSDVESPPPKRSPCTSVADSVRKEVVPEKDKVSSLPKKVESRVKAPTGNLGSITNFSVLMNSQAHNNYDKFLILEARDKNIRSKQEKVMDVSKARYLSATCPDMCPEKERYSRDIQYDISVYEMTNAKMDPKMVVKKFSRSSADKDEPLPHELRPGPVLKMTMDFLNCNIIAKGDEEDVQTEYWYNYLCNRTRALRNDIMQQHLVDCNAVYVLERCIRFHIHCSHELCEESVESFDPRVNFEHLGKSLQSLKELYQDLGERGVYLDSEAEFRGYEVLLNLSDGNVVFRFQQFRTPVRNSKHVQFAVRVLYAFSSNNYAAFFRLIKEASYLEACIMHKYFQNIRIKALGSIAKAYTSQSLPLEKIVGILNVSTKSKCQAYLEPFGLEVTEDSKVNMDKCKFILKPDTLPPVSRSEDVTAKKGRPLAEIIQNGTLPSNPVHTYLPHDSFDSKGKLRPEAVEALDQMPAKGEDIGGSELQEAAAASEEISLEREHERLLQELSSKVDEMYKRNLLRKCLMTWRDNVKKQLEMNRLKAEAILVLVKKTARIWRKKAAKSAELRKKADNHMKARFFRRWESYIEHVKEMRGYLQRAKAIEERILARIYVNKWKEYVDFRKSLEKARSHLLSFKYVRRWKYHTKLSLAERRSDAHYRFKLLRSYFDHWRLWWSMFGAKNKLDFSSFPASGSLLSPKEQNQLLDWGYDREDGLDMSAQQILELNESIFSKSRIHYSLQQLSGLVAWSALPILQRFQADVNTKSPDYSRNIFARYFKVVIFVESELDPYLLEWVRTKFNISEVNDLSSPFQCKVAFTSCRDGATYYLIVNESEFAPPYNLEVDGASLVVLVVKEDKLREASSLAAEKLDQVPFLVLCKSLSENIDDNKWMMTKKTIDDPYTSEKLFYLVLKVWQTRTRRLHFLKGRCNEVVTEFISKTVLFPVYQSVSHRKLYGSLMPCPAQIVVLYNSALRHTRECFNNHKSTCQWPPKELLHLTTKQSKLWNEEDTEVVMSSLQAALLPCFSVVPSASWTSLEKGVADFVKEVSGEEWNGSVGSEVQKIFSTFRSMMESHRERAPYHQVPWVDILNVCIFFKLSLLPTTEIGYSHQALYAGRHEEALSRLRSSEITRLKVEEVPAKRKVEYCVQLKPKKRKRDKSHSLLLADIQNEKELSLKYEQELNKMVLVEGDLEALFSSYTHPNSD